MRTSVWTAAAGFVIALIASLAQPAAYDFFRFNFEYARRQQQTAAVRDTIRLFSASMAGFYATGYTAGLVQFPAENPIRRRIFQDLRNWEQSGVFLVMDRDKSVVREVTFVAPDLAVVLVDESWFSIFQDSRTRRPVSDKKANVLTVRYYLKKQWGRWIVFEYEVYEREDRVPPVRIEQVLKTR